jgi:hypothetical protein
LFAERRANRTLAISRMTDYKLERMKRKTGSFYSAERFSGTVV